MKTTKIPAVPRMPNISNDVAPMARHCIGSKLNPKKSIRSCEEREGKVVLLRFGLVPTPLPGAGARQEEVEAEPSSASPDGITLPSALITTFLLGMLLSFYSQLCDRARRPKAGRRPARDQGRTFQRSGLKQYVSTYDFDVRTVPASAPRRPSHLAHHRQGSSSTTAPSPQARG